jgi:hypothetical protein
VDEGWVKTMACTTKPAPAMALLYFHDDPQEKIPRRSFDSFFWDAPK